MAITLSRESAQPADLVASIRRLDKEGLNAALQLLGTDPEPQYERALLSPSFLAELKATLDCYSSEDRIASDAGRLKQVAECVRSLLEHSAAKKHLLALGKEIAQLIITAERVAPREASRIALSASAAGVVLTRPLVLNVIASGLENVCDRTDLLALTECAKFLKCLRSSRSDGPGAVDEKVHSAEQRARSRVAGAFTRSVRRTLDLSPSRGRSNDLTGYAALLCTLLEVGVLTEANLSQPTTTGRLVYNLQRASPEDAARVCAAAIKQGYLISKDMTCATWSIVEEHAQSWQHLRPAVDLAIEALERRVVDISQPKVLEMYNVLLSRLCTPYPLASPGLPQFVPENDLMNIGYRMMYGARLASALTRHSVELQDLGNVSRINDTIRALCTIGDALHFEHLRLTEGLPESTMEHIRSGLHYQFDYIPLRAADVATDAAKDLAHALIRSAVDLTIECTRYPRRDEIHQRRVELYELKGSTINTLLYSLEAAFLAPNIFDALKVLQVIEKAAARRISRSGLSSYAISSFLRSVFESPELVDEEKAFIIARVVSLPLGNTLDKGFLEQVRALVSRVCHQKTEANELSSEFLSRLAQSLEPRMHQICEMRGETSSDLVRTKKRASGHSGDLSDAQGEEGWFSQLLKSSDFDFSGLVEGE